ncbi:MAG: sulfatase-like hydrolase/transferase, partial [Planctomycetes bacterium]|nr:sulfatase-like hydrolase/transferase [Planctomycetota bacterium]
DYRRDPLHKTLAAGFHEAGYRTGGFFSGPYLDPKYGFGDGFDDYASGMMTPDDLAQRIQIWMTSNERQGGPPPPPSFAKVMRDRLSHLDITSPRVNAHADRFLSDVGQKPFFLFLHYFDAHYDHIPDAAELGLAGKFDPGYKGQMIGENWYFNGAVRSTTPPHERRISDRDLEHVQALYEAEIHWVDRHIGMILSQLEQSGLADNTIIAIVGDHGDEFFEHGSIGHRSTLYAELMRIPMILHIPGVADSGARVSSVSRIYDIAPTLLDFAGIPALPHSEGVSLRPELEGQSTQHGALGRIFFGSPSGPNIQDSWRNTRYTVIRGFGIDGNNSNAAGLAVRQKRANANGALLVFDRAEDPKEMHPLPQKDPRYQEAVKLFRVDFLQSEAMSASLPHSPIPHRWAPSKTAEEQATLDSLGYTSSDDDNGETQHMPPLKPFPAPNPAH